jgi:hypothetical protein
MWYDEFDSIFFITIAATIAALAGLIIKSCYKSKCKEFSCCYGMLTIERDTNTEQLLDSRTNRSDTIPMEI